MWDELEKQISEIDASNYFIQNHEKLVRLIVGLSLEFSIDEGSDGGWTRHNLTIKERSSENALGFALEITRSQALIHHVDFIALQLFSGSLIVNYRRINSPVFPFMPLPVDEEFNDQFFFDPESDDDSIFRTLMGNICSLLQEHSFCDPHYESILRNFK